MRRLAPERLLCADFPYGGTRRPFHARNASQFRQRWQRSHGLWAELSQGVRHAAKDVDWLIWCLRRGEQCINRCGIPYTSQCLRCHHADANLGILESAHKAGVAEWLAAPAFRNASAASPRTT